MHLELVGILQAAACIYSSTKRQRYRWQRGLSMDMVPSATDRVRAIYLFSTFVSFGAFLVKHTTSRPVIISLVSTRLTSSRDRQITPHPSPYRGILGPTHFHWTRWSWSLARASNQGKYERWPRWFGGVIGPG